MQYLLTGKNRVKLLIYNNIYISINSRLIKCKVSNFILFFINYQSKKVFKVIDKVMVNLFG